MNVNGIGGSAAQLLRPQESARPRVEQERAAGGAIAAQAAVAPKTAASGLLAPRQEGLSVEAPEGTDPELWKVLTSEERSFFARMSAGGPLTYGRWSAASTPQAPLVRGGRLDIRV